MSIMMGTGPAPTIGARALYNNWCRCRVPCSRIRHAVDECIRHALIHGATYDTAEDGPMYSTTDAGVACPTGAGRMYPTTGAGAAPPVQPRCALKAPAPSPCQWCGVHMPRDLLLAVHRQPATLLVLPEVCSFRPLLAVWDLPITANPQCNLGPSCSVRLLVAPCSVGPAVSWAHRQPATPRNRLRNNTSAQQKLLAPSVEMMLSDGATTLIFFILDELTPWIPPSCAQSLLEHFRGVRQHDIGACSLAEKGDMESAS